MDKRLTSGIDIGGIEGAAYQILLTSITVLMYWWFISAGNGGAGGIEGGNGGPGSNVQIFYNTNTSSQGAKQNNRVDVGGINVACDHPTDEELCGTIARWLSDLNFERTQADIFAKHTEGTGQWLLESKTFKDWVEGRLKNLWCPGDRELVVFAPR